MSYACAHDWVCSNKCVYVEQTVCVHLGVHRGCVLTNVHMLVWVPANIGCCKGYNKSSGARRLIFQLRSSLLSPLRLVFGPTETGVHCCITHNPQRANLHRHFPGFLRENSPNEIWQPSDKVAVDIRGSSRAEWAWGERGCFLCSIRNQFSILCLICCCRRTPDKPWNPI